jgi:dTMP kinase
VAAHSNEFALPSLRRTDGDAHGAGSNETGALFVFEGPDGVGKSTLVTALHKLLVMEATGAVTQLALPGAVPGTLGKHVYELHHNPTRYGIRRMSATSLQLLHVAAHADALETIIRPRLQAGEIVLLDRFWWSTWVYGITGGADRQILRALIDVERAMWRQSAPEAVFLIRRRSSTTSEEGTLFSERESLYYMLSEEEARSTRVVLVDNDDTVQHTALTLLQTIRQIRPLRTRT